MGRKPRFVLIFPLLLIFAAPFISPAAFWSRPFLKRKIALTFDDGPKPFATRRLLRVLKRQGVVGTFFIVGRMAAAHPELVRALFKEGHEIANHTWSHSDLKNMSPEEFADELEGTRQLIRELTGRNSFLFRTPGSTENFIRKHFVVPPKYTLILWDVHSLDQRGLPADQIAARVESAVKDGDIILMHNGIKSTPEALAILIPDLKSRGFKFLTVSELIKYRQKFLTSAVNQTIIHG